MNLVSKFSVDSTLYWFVRLRMSGLVTKSDIIYNVTNVQEVVVVRSRIVTSVSRVVSRVNSTEGKQMKIARGLIIIQWCT